VGEGRSGSHGQPPRSVSPLLVQGRLALLPGGPAGEETDRGPAPPAGRRPYLLPDGEEAVRPPDGGYTDLAWLLLCHLQEHKPEACERFLLSQIEGTGRDVGWFEKCFGVGSAADWKNLERAIYARIN
jgi:hypothetical protein